MSTPIIVTMIVSMGFIIDRAGFGEADAGGDTDRIRAVADIVVASHMVLHATVAGRTTEGVCIVRSEQGSMQMAKPKNVYRCRGGEHQVLSEARPTIGALSTFEMRTDRAAIWVGGDMVIVTTLAAGPHIRSCHCNKMIVVLMQILGGKERLNGERETPLEKILVDCNRGCGWQAAEC